MKHRNFIKNSIVALLSITLGFGVFLGVNKGKQPQSVVGTTSQTSLPKTITLKDNTGDEIRSYYASLNNLTDSERQGTNLLKHLKEIIHDDIVYYPYGSISSAGVTQIYTITDRDWDNSPASSIVGGTYNATTKTITNYNHATEKNNNPYIKMLYVDYSRNGPTRFLNGTSASFDKEHVWSQSHGFKADKGATGPAGTDLHHLIAGEKAVNQQYHSNWSYGNVKVAEKEAAAGAKSTIEPKFIISGNKLGTPLNSHTSDEVNKVFEPNDSDKGRIARALLYMAACYNNYSGHETITDFDPNLQLVDYIIDGGTSVSSSSSSPAKYGILSDLLEWNRTYLPDSFEIHRNNLIYNNYQFNRNPFIDFPEWADFIWGNADSSYQSTGYATPESDIINGYNSGGTPVAVSGVTLNTNSTSVEVGSNVSLTATVAPSNATNKSVTWTTSNSNVATVSNGVVSGVAEGSAIITATTSDGGYTATCSVTVTASSGGGDSNASQGSITASSGSLSGWTASGTGSAYADGSVKFDNGGDNVYKIDIFSGDVSSCMTSLTVTINGKINGTPTATNSYKVEALDSNGNVLASDVKTGASIVTTDYGDTTFTINSGLTGCTGIRVTYVTKGGGNWGIKSISWSATYSTEEEETKTLSSISLDTSESQTTFYVGDDFNYDELVVTANYDDGSSDIVGPTSVSTPDLSTIGTKTVSVSYTEGGVTKTATYQISVKHPGSTETSQMIVSKSSSIYYSDGAIYLTGSTSLGSASCDAFTATQTRESGYSINYTSDEIKVYAGHRFVITPSSNYVLTSIVLYAYSSGYASNIGEVTNCTKSVTESVVTLSPIDGSLAVGFYNTTASWINYVIVNFEETHLLWNSPTINVYSGSTLTASDVNSWEVTDGSTTYTSANLTIKLGGETIAIPHTWSASDDGKVIKAYHNGLSTNDSSSIQVTQSINNIYKESTSSNEVSWTVSSKNDLGSTISSVNGTATGTIMTGSYPWNYTRTLEALTNTKSDYVEYQGNTWLQLGSGNALESLVFTTNSIPGIIKKVVVITASSYSQHTITIDVGGTKYLDGAALQEYTGNAGATNPNPNTSGCTKIGTGSSSGAITISLTPKDTDTKKALLIRSILVTYETPGALEQIANNTDHIEAQRLAVLFANTFNGFMDETENCTTRLDAAWASCSTAYTLFKSSAASLGESEETWCLNLIKYATAQYSDDSGEACIERMMKTYEVCVQKHGKTAFMSDLVTLGQAPISLISLVQGNNKTILAVVIISLVSVSAIGGYFFLRTRRKKDY